MISASNDVALQYERDFLLGKNNCCVRLMKKSGAPL